MNEQFNRRNWLAKLLCLIGIHRWEFGPGECCATCGIEDWVWENAEKGRLAINPKTKVSGFFPPSSPQLPSGWRWF